MKEYIIQNYPEFKSELCFWVTGHSMGGGVANLVASKLIDGYGNLGGNRDNVYCYTFAAPNTFYKTDNVNYRYSAYKRSEIIEERYREPKASKYRCIFNIVNDDDFVPKLPMEECEWTKYGRVGKNSLKTEYYQNYDKLNINISVVGSGNNIRITNYNLYSFLVEYKGDKNIVKNSIIDEFVKIFDTKDMRKESYNYSKYGDLEYKYVNNNEHSVCKIAMPYQKLSGIEKGYEYIERNGSVIKNRIMVYTQKQMPEYLFQTIAFAMHQKDESGNTAIFDGIFNKAKLKFARVPKRYTTARDKLVENNKLVNHPHYLESYYVLSKLTTTNDFK